MTPKRWSIEPVRDLTVSGNAFAAATSGNAGLDIVGRVAADGGIGYESEMNW
jgi:hypothetical protein